MLHSWRTQVGRGEKESTIYESNEMLPPRHNKGTVARQPDLSKVVFGHSPLVIPENIQYMLRG